MARTKSLPTKTVHPNKLFSKEYIPPKSDKYSNHKKSVDNKDENLKSTLSILIFLFFFLKYKVYKFENIKFLFNEHLNSYLTPIDTIDIVSIFTILLLIYPNNLIKLFEKFIIFGLKLLLIVEFTLSFIKN